MRVEYRTDLTASDLPIAAETLNLGFTVNYVQSDDTGIVVPGRSLLKVVSGDGTNTSDEVCIGEECFYVMYSDEDNITMISKYNLYVGGNKTADGYIEYGEEATGKQNSSILGYVTTGYPWIGTLKFSSTKYWSSTVSTYPAYVYDSNSTLYTYVENYKTYLSILGVTPVEARLITSDELIDLGCDFSSSIGCKNAQSFIRSTSYWSGSAYSSEYIYAVYSHGGVTYLFNTSNLYFGCRPVIVIPKSFVVDNFS